MGVLARIWYILLFILIGGLFFYDNVWWTEYNLSMEGIERKAQFFGKIVNISNDYFYFNTGSSNLRVESFNMPPIRKAKYGETVVYTIYKENSIIKGIDYHNYDYNYVLYLLSFIALIIFLIILFKEWKLTSRGFENA